MALCSYFQAEVQRDLTWLFVALLRSNEYLCFDRTLDVPRGLFEFFVPTGNVDRFLEVMRGLADRGLVRNVQVLPNRLAEPGAVL
ncbi:MAG: hypothetical protein M1549_02765 [Candidatus Dependentiae bacterium]|nr:hypothetical protein [Candidatus Dependentiae bacterium]